MKIAVGGKTQTLFFRDVRMFTKCDKRVKPHVPLFDRDWGKERTEGEFDRCSEETDLEERGR